MNYTSFAPWAPHTAWIRSSVTRGFKILFCNKMSQELKVIKKFASWNDFPKYIVSIIFCETIQTHEDKSEPNLTVKKNKVVVIYLCLPYYEDKGLQFLKSCMHKIKVNFKNEQPVQDLT